MAVNCKHLLILGVLTFAVFGVALSGQFVGDDHVLFEGNSFYTSWTHWPDLFSTKYLTASTPSSGQGTYHSGSVAYRPVLSFTYFCDYAVWHLNPFGYHLTNVLLHTANVLLLYVVLAAIIQMPSAAMFGALLFGLHPTKVEAVANIGYRADVLMCFWLLLSLWMWIRYRQENQAGWGWAAVIAYFLGLFAKEAAIVLPMLCLAYDVYFKMLRSRHVYMAFAGITLFYLYVYFFLFHNTSLAGNTPLPVGTMCWVFARYVLDLVLPFVAVMLPPVYTPAVEPWGWAKMLAGLALLGGVMGAIIGFYRTRREISLFLLWFLVALIPVANIIPLANPMAHRFLYVPSIGFAAAAAAAVRLLPVPPNIRTIIMAGMVGVCAVYTVPLTMRWNNDVAVATTLIEIYPRDVKGHSILAWQLLKNGRTADALREFDECIRLGSQDPYLYYLAASAALPQDPAKAEAYFKRAIAIYPGVDAPFVALGRLYLRQGRYREAVGYLEQAVRLQPEPQSLADLRKAQEALGKDHP